MFRFLYFFASLFLFSWVTINACDDYMPHDEVTSPRSPKTSLEGLPQELLLNIAQHLNKTDHDNLRLVSTHFASAFSDFYVLSAIKSVFNLTKKEDFNIFIKKYGANDKEFYDDAPMALGMTIKLQGDWVTDDILSQLSKATTVDLSMCFNITDEGLAHLKYATTVKLTWCYKITDEGLAHLQNAKSVRLTGCIVITDKGLIYLQKATTVNLSECCKITNEGLKYLQNAKIINLAECRNITDKGLTHLKNAVTVDLTWCWKITDEGLTHLTNATTVNLTGCANITDDAKNNLRNRGIKILC